MSRAITEPAQPLDGMSPGDAVIGLVRQRRNGMTT